MKAPQVQKSIGHNDAKAQLQLALDHIAEIYTMIGSLPYAVTETSEWQPFLRLYDKGARKLDDLSTDEIPF